MTATLLALTIFAGFLDGLHGIAAETYSENSMCIENNCVNPIFPGLNDLSRLSALQWQCSTYSATHAYLRFCKDTIDYDPALPSPNATMGGVPINELIRAQDNAAATMYFYHLNGMGYDAWSFTEPQHVPDDCIKAVWRMVCFTYFPRSEAGCQTGEGTRYMRPCESCCQNYVRQCNVECCDESVSCTFQHTVDLGRGQALVQTGYVDHMGPSALCTGGARHATSLPIALILGIFGIHMVANAAELEVGSSRASQKQKASTSTVQRLSGANVFFATVVLAIALSLQGCDVSVPKHNVANWRRKEDYLTQFEFVPPGAPATSAVLNSCADPSIPATEQCNGHGYCKPFFKDPAPQGPLTFCSCDLGWADPECRTQRKSQIVAYVLALFFGCFGADQFYLGFPILGFAKLITFGGFGGWWLLDIVRTGVGPVYSVKFQVAHDLPKWVYGVSTLAFFMIVSFSVSIWLYLSFRRRKREEYLQLQRDEEEKHFQSTEEDYRGPRFEVPGPQPPFSGHRNFSGYGSTLPMRLPNAGEPYASGYPTQTGPPGGPFGGYDN